MGERNELAPLGVLMVLLGLGICIVTSVGLIDRNIVDLPLGESRKHVEQAGRDPWTGPIAGSVLMILGIVVVAVASSRHDAHDREDDPSDP